jgi:hypothetical protein
MRQRHFLAASLVSGMALAATHLSYAGQPSVTLFDQGLLQVLQASVTGLQPKQPYVLGLVDNPDGSGPVDGLANFMTNPAGSDIVNAIGPIRQVVSIGTDTSADKRRYLVIAPKVAGKAGEPVQVQAI